MPLAPLESGDPTRLGRYELTGRLGEGGQGVVYLARDADGSRFAVKVLRTSAEPKTLERLARELDAVHQVQPFVTASVVEASTDGSRRYVVTEYIDGPSLHERVATGGPLRDGELHRLAVGTATALTAIHGAGVIHRDFKPANVLLGPDGPRVVDFGIARLIDTGTITSQLIGTPAYLAPEQLRGESATPAVDVFAWGVTIVFAATGEPPFGSDAVHAVMNRILTIEPDLSALPTSLRDVIGACLAKDPSRRPNARDLLVRLVDPSASAATAEQSAPPKADEAATVVPVSSGGADVPTEPAGQVRAGRGRTVALAGATLAVLAALGAGAWLLSEHSGHGRPESERTGGKQPVPSRSAPAAPPASTQPSGGPAVPAAYAGTWSGTIVERVLTTKNTALRIILTAGRNTGEADYDDQACKGVLTLTGNDGSGSYKGKGSGKSAEGDEGDGELTFDLAFPDGGCVAGTVTLKLEDGQLDYNWHDPFGLASSQGLLHRDS